MSVTVKTNFPFPTAGAKVQAPVPESNCVLSKAAAVSVPLTVAFTKVSSRFKTTLALALMTKSSMATLLADVMVATVPDPVTTSPQVVNPSATLAVEEIVVAAQILSVITASLEVPAALVATIVKF